MITLLNNNKCTFSGASKHTFQFTVELRWHSLDLTVKYRHIPSLILRKVLSLHYFLHLVGCVCEIVFL
jgi:hypothetical protein